MKALLGWTLALPLGFMEAERLSVLEMGFST
jgi:hypothetical protein